MPRPLREPFKSPGDVTGDALAEDVYEADAALGLGDTGLGGLDEPAGGLLGVFDQALAFGVHDGQLVLGLGDTLPGGFPKPLGGLCVILGDARPF